MVSASSDKTIRVWNVDVDAGKLHCVEVLDQGSACFWCDFDGKKLLCSGFGFIRQFDVISQSEVRCALFCRRIILTSRASAEFVLTLHHHLPGRGEQLLSGCCQI